ncbi:MAG: hypothetical protein JO015_07475 [Verrucomicrobia bacterium]|nr:hypothetical protein [Verrucomicrobiota bacterium]
MSTISRFDPPANLADFNDAQRRAWDETISYWFDANIKDTGGVEGADRSQFYNPGRESTDDPSISEADGTITWQGFPKSIEEQFGDGTTAAWQAAEGPANRVRVQDEYLEWHTERDARNRIVRVTFTCEPPEYWEALADGYPSDYTGPKREPGAGERDELLQLYRTLVGPQVQLADLLTDGKYNPVNRWNTKDGIVHLTQRSNTLGAEINLAAQATVLRHYPDGTPIADEQDLIGCSGFGTATRASDPHIGQVVNMLAAQGYSLTLRNPVGLYIHRLDTAGWTKPGPGNTRVPTGNEFWRVVRGHDDYVVRAVYEVPAGTMGPDGQQMTVDDIQIAGAHIRFGGQIAKKIQMKLVATGCRQGQSRKRRYACGESPAAPAPVGVAGDLAPRPVLPSRTGGGFSRADAAGVHAD